MRVALWFLVWCAAAVVGVSGAGLSPAAMLNQELPPPPRRAQPIIDQGQRRLMQEMAMHAPQHMQPTSLLEGQAHAHVGMSVEAKIAAEAALAVEESVLASASVEDTMTAKGALSAEEQLLVERMIPVPKTRIPDDPAVKIEYMFPPTRDELHKTGVRGYPWPEKLQAALTTVQSAATQRIGAIKRQMKWSKAAETLVEQLAAKKTKVNAHVQKLTEEIKTLLRQKKLIQNKQLQDKLVERLDKTHRNLQKVRRQTHNIRKNQADMVHHKEKLSHALEDIRRSLAILKGMPRKRLFPQQGAAKKLKHQLSLFDPDLSHEAEAHEVRALQFPDAVFAETNAEAETTDSVDSESEQLPAALVETQQELQQEEEQMEQQ